MPTSRLKWALWGLLLLSVSGACTLWAYSWSLSGGAATFRRGTGSPTLLSSAAIDPLEPTLDSSRLPSAGALPASSQVPPTVPPSAPTATETRPAPGGIPVAPTAPAAPIAAWWPDGDSSNPDCKTIGPEHPCFEHIVWAMKTGVQRTPDGYGNLTADSGFEHWQAYFKAKANWGSPKAKAHCSGEGGNELPYPCLPSAPQDSSASRQVAGGQQDQQPQQSDTGLLASLLKIFSPGKGESEGKLFVRFGGSGWNNQRQTLVASAWMARALGRTLRLPKNFKSSFHDAAAIAVESVLNIEALRAFVDVELGPEPANLKPIKIEADPYCLSRARAGDLRNVAAPYAARNIVSVAPWIYSGTVLDFTADSVGVTAEEFFGAFQMHDDIKTCADTVVADLLRECQGGLHGVHMRVTDRHPFPLLDCGKGKELFGRETRMHQREGRCQFVDAKKDVEAADVLLADPSPSGALGQSSCVYTATDGASHKQTGSFIETIRAKSGARAILYADISPKMSKSCKAVNPSILEQAIVASVPYLLRGFSHHCAEEF